MMMMRVMLVVTILVLGHSFYTYLPTGRPECFYSNIYGQERLLIEVETPIISLRHQVVITVKNGNTTMLEQNIVNEVKITVPRASNVFRDQVNNQDSLQYETCFKVIVDPTTPSTPIDPSTDNAIIERKGYLLHVKMVTNFIHKIQSVKQRLSAQLGNLDYKELSKQADKLKKINSQQIGLHQVNEVKQKLSQNYLQNMKQKIILYSMLQMIMVISFTVIQVHMLKGYINQLSIV